MSYSRIYTSTPRFLQCVNIAHYASTVLAVVGMLSVCPSISLLRAGILSQEAQLLLR